MDEKTLEVVLELILGIIIGLGLSWSIGLLPAIVYRYVVYKKPIDKKKVFRRLAPFVIFIGLFYKIIMADLTQTQPNPSPIPWIIIYYIGKWIMTRESKK